MNEIAKWVKENTTYVGTHRFGRIQGRALGLKCLELIMHDLNIMYCECRKINFNVVQEWAEDNRNEEYVNMLNIPLWDFATALLDEKTINEYLAKNFKKMISRGEKEWKKK